MREQSKRIIRAATERARLETDKLSLDRLAFFLLQGASRYEKDN